MITFPRQRIRAIRRATRELRRSVTGDQDFRATVTGVRWDPLGGLHLSILVRGGRPGPAVLGEIRDRGGRSLLGFHLRHEQSPGGGVLLVGSVPSTTLATVRKGRHDLWVSAMVDGARRMARLSADATLAFPPPKQGLEIYRTAHGNLSLRREHTVREPVRSVVLDARVDARQIAPDLAQLTQTLSAHLRQSQALGTCDLSYHFLGRDGVSFDGLFPGLAISTWIERAPTGWTLSLCGRDKTSQRFLRNVLINRSRMTIREGQQAHLLPGGASDTSGTAAHLQLSRALVDILDRFRLFLDAGPRPEEHGLLPAQWWDIAPNFGDLLGPMLIESLSGRSAINVRSFPSEDPGLYTVGSIVGHLERAGAQIWGSGLMREPSSRKVGQLATVAPRHIHAVRGAHTREALQNLLGWQVPEVYGDPALLLPRFYEPSPAPQFQGKVALVPHYTHRALFTDDLPEDVAVVDVRQGPEVVIDQIAAARACISSSLHGLVVAQAWQVPWTWLRVGDVQLRGDTFKFEDYYTVLDREAVHELHLTEAALPAQDWPALARSASVPRTHFDADRLIGAFPTS